MSVNYKTGPVILFYRCKCYGCGNKDSEETVGSIEKPSVSVRAGHDGKHKVESSREYLQNQGLEPKSHSWTIGRDNTM